MFPASRPSGPLAPTSRPRKLNRARDWTAFAIVAILGAYTHYYFVIFPGYQAPS